ncbi:hypothetical protein [uncultured Mediterranean phage]|nr:hypothetical protein [uncultured Mediterranean phage]
MINLGSFIKNYLYGSWNALSDSTMVSGDLRRGSAVSEASRALQEVYDKDCLAGVKHFYGIVCHSVDRTHPSAEVKSSQASVSKDGTVGPYPTYKVYVPELEARPIPRSLDDPVLATYQDYRVSEGLAVSPGIGAIVKIRYDDPEKLYGPAIIGVEGSVDPTFVPSSRVSLSGVSGAGSALPVSGECEPSGKKRGADLKFTLAELKVLTIPLRELLDFIAVRESGGSYEAVNRGCAGDTRGGAEKWVGKKLVNLTVNEIRNYQKPACRGKGTRRRCDGGKWAEKTKKGGVCGSDQTDDRVFPEASEVPGVNMRFGFLAVGKYQWIPSTLKWAVGNANLKKLNPTFTPEVQEAMGAQLLLSKRAPLGRYLVGLSNDACAAGQSAALEWASLPLQYRFRKCSRGFSAYCSGGANPTSRLKHTPEEILERLHRGRTSLLGNAAAVGILRQKGYLGNEGVA